MNGIVITLCINFGSLGFCVGMGVASLIDGGSSGGIQIMLGLIQIPFIVNNFSKLGN